MQEVEVFTLHKAEDFQPLANSLVIEGFWCKFWKITTIYEAKE